jgi:hypothetical protein
LDLALQLDATFLGSLLQPNTTLLDLTFLRYLFIKIKGEPAVYCGQRRKMKKNINYYHHHHHHHHHR